MTVVALKPVDETPAPVNPALIAMLNDMLERAQSGEITGAALVGIGPPIKANGGTIATSWVPAFGNLAEIMGAIEVLKYDILQAQVTR